MPVLKVIKFALVCIFFLSTFTNTVKANSPVMTTEHWVIKHFTKFIRYGRSRQHSHGLIHMDGIKTKFLAEFDQVDHGFDGITQEELESFSKLKKIISIARHYSSSTKEISIKIRFSLKKNLKNPT